MKKVKWALIGCGKVVLKNKTTPFNNHKNKIISICTTSIENSNKAISQLKLKNCTGYDNVYEMLNSESMDAIYICTPPKFHYEYLKILSEYNIPIIYVEKPFVLNKNEAKIIKQIYKNKKTNIFVAHYKRLLPQIKKLKNIIQKKKYGKVEYIEGIFKRKFNKELLTNSWIYKKEISGGGRFFDIAPHIIDVIYYIFGSFKNIKSIVLHNQKEHLCESNLTTKFCVNNIPCTLSFDLDSNVEEDVIYIYCSKGIIKTSINRDRNIYIYNMNNALIKKYKFHKIKVWGIEAINEIDNFYLHKKKHYNIATLDDAYITQGYIDKMLHQ